MTDTWSMDQLREFVAGSAVASRGWDGENAPPPAWLQEAAMSVIVDSWIDQTVAAHPTDRGAFGRLWLQAIREPGEVMQMHWRVYRDDAWHRQRLSILNLLGHPEVERVLWRVDQDETIDDVEDAGVPLPDSFESPPWVILRTDRNGQILHVDGMAERLFGRPASAMLGRAIIGFVHSESHDSLMSMWPEVVAVPQLMRTAPWRVIRPDRTTLWIESSVMNQLEDNGSILLVSHDITDRRAREAALRASQEESARLAQEFRMLAEEAPSAVFRVGVTGEISFGNARWFELIAGCGPVVMLRDLVHPDSRLEVDLAVAELVDPSGPDSRSLEVRSADGSRLFSLTCRAVGEASLGRRTIIGGMYDATATAELRQLAESDVLTGLLNRHALDRRLAAALLDSRVGLVVVFVDLDGFKSINDAYGHDAGDTVLQRVAERLRQAVRPTDDIGRYGGDEFVLVCHDVAEGAEADLVARIDDSLNSLIEFDGGHWICRASLGTTRYRSGDDAAALLQRADHAMYETKRARKAAARSMPDR